MASGYIAVVCYIVGLFNKRQIYVKVMIKVTNAARFRDRNLVSHLCNTVTTVTSVTRSAGDWI